MYDVLLALSTLLYGGLTADLGAADYRVRERATAALAAAPWLALPAIDAAAHSPDAERQQRAESVLRRKCVVPERVLDCVGVLRILGRRGAPHPTDAEYEWLWSEGRRAELFKQLCFNLGLYEPSKAGELTSDRFFWWGETGKAEWVAVMRMRAARTPMAWPADPFGPKDEIPLPREVRDGDEDEGDQGGRDGGRHPTR